MPKTDDDALGPALERRLRRELNRVQPRFSSPRYASAAHPRVRTWRLAPVALGVSLVSILALSAFVATGSANPVVWTQRVVTVIESNPPPTSEPSPVLSVATNAKALRAFLSTCGSTRLVCGQHRPWYRWPAFVPTRRSPCRPTVAGGAAIDRQHQRRFGARHP